MGTPNFEGYNSEALNSNETIFSDVYYQPILNLTNRSLRKVNSEDLGWVDKFGTVISCRKKFYDLENNQFQLTEYRETGLPITEDPSQIRLVIWEQTIDRYGIRKSSNFDIKYYYPKTKKLQSLRLENIPEEIRTDQNQLAEVFELEKKFSMIEASEEEYYTFCLALMIGAR